MVVAVILICYALILWIWTFSSILKRLFAAAFRAYIKAIEHAVTEELFETVLENIKRILYDTSC